MSPMAYTFYVTQRSIKTRCWRFSLPDLKAQVTFLITCCSSVRLYVIELFTCSCFFSQYLASIQMVYMWKYFSMYFKMVHYDSIKFTKEKLKKVKFDVNAACIFLLKKQSFTTNVCTKV